MSKSKQSRAAPTAAPRIVEARRLRVHAQDCGGTAYTELSVVAP
jgi:hypothetical protein